METGQRRAAKTLLFSFIVIVCQVAGNALLSWAMKRDQTSIAQATALLPAGAVPEWLSPFFSVFLWLGIGLLVVSLLSRMTLLTWADLSFVAPVTALGYVLNVVAGAIVLGEAVDAKRWVGSLLVVAGSALVGATMHAHAPQPPSDAPVAEAQDGFRS
jgi:drug/metabolite transporter (DMT)-like permease